MIEIWKNVENYEGLYQVSNLGNVKSLQKTRERIIRDTLCKQVIPERILKLRVTRFSPYQICQLWKQSKSTTFYVHRLVATTFVNNDHNKNQVNHIDGNKLNNCSNNLEWNTKSENGKHAYTNGLSKPMIGDKNGHAKIKNNEAIELRKLIDSGLYKSIDIAKAWKISPSIIYNMKNNSTWCKVLEDVVIKLDKMIDYLESENDKSGK